MSNEEVELLYRKAEEEYDRLKDRLIFLDLENKELKEKIEELQHEIEVLKQSNEDTERYYQDNWRPIPTSTYYGIKERDFY